MACKRNLRGYLKPYYLFNNRCLTGSDPIKQPDRFSSQFSRTRMRQEIGEYIKIGWFYGYSDLNNNIFG